MHPSEFKNFSLDNEIMQIMSDPIRRFVQEILSETNDKFYSIPASSSGKYHPEQSNRLGGLVLHTKMVCEFAKIICRAYNCSQAETDVVLAACILHDINKPDYEHAIITYKKLIAHRNQYPYISECDFHLIANSIKWHMGRWTPKPYHKPITEYTKEEWICHLADMVATNQMLEFKFEGEHENV